MKQEWGPRPLNLQLDRRLAGEHVKRLLLGTGEAAEGAGGLELVHALHPGAVLLLFDRLPPEELGLFVAFVAAITPDNRHPACSDRAEVGAHGRVPVNDMPTI